MLNTTSYDGRTILRWIRACFRSSGHAKATKSLRVRVDYNRGAHCWGIAERGNEKHPGTYLRLSLPQDPGKLSAADFSFCINYLALIARGHYRRDMSRAQKTTGVREWAKDLPLPVHRSPTDPPKSTATEKRRTVVERRAKHARSMFTKYSLLESTCAAELLRLGKLKKSWAAKVAYYEKKGF